MKDEHYQQDTGMITETGDLAAIIVNYCQYQETLGCLRSLKKAGIAEERIVVVDNASPDGSGEKLLNTLDNCQFLQAPENGGYGAGNNRAINYLLSDQTPKVRYVLIFNPDVRVHPDAIQEVVQKFENNRNLGGVSFVQRRSAEDDTLDPNFESWLRSEGVSVGQLREESFISTDTLLGAAMGLSREAILEIGGFDPLYFMYAEEEDLARRLRYHGFDTGIAADAYVVHSRPYRQKGQSREFQRQSSQYLFRIKDPFASVGLNFLRAARYAGGRLVRAVYREDSSVRSWLGEMAWVVPRVPTALRNRSQEMKGSAHLGRGRSDLAREAQR